MKHTLYIPALSLFLSMAACQQAHKTPQAEEVQNTADEVIASTEPTTDTVAAKDAPAAPATETPGYSSITLLGYECGDNCYLVYSNAGGKEERALCRAGICGSWEKAQALPKALVGKQVKARMGKGEQYDAAGNKMSSDFPSVEEILVP